MATIMKKPIMVITTIQRIVVQTTPQEKKAIAVKAKRLGLPISELMRRGANTYQPEKENKELYLLADKAENAANSAADSIDELLAFIEESNQRISAMQSRTQKKG